MKIPMKVDYGVRALVELAMHHGNGPVPTSEIASKQGIPESYLVQLMSTLNHCGYVQSRRGPQGGHSLAMDPSDINLHMIMTTLDGNSSPLDCLTYVSDCIFADSCAQQEIWKSVEEAIESVLANITLEHLARRQEYLSAQGV
ncbi:HTH-type transcriptional regulator IscR [Geodia barretti]|uniref:HTH-type transcriptional regulator IscR n=1 Tax=Geodia barretti TaxID=519541 RepID=A0AA35RVK1_GEOBA|nr:HTH-type transcriptional regulator IscR [Geodia barretti]